MSSDTHSRKRYSSHSPSRRSRSRSASPYSYSDDSFASDSDDRYRRKERKAYSNPNPNRKKNVKKQTKKGVKQPTDIRNFDEVTQRMLSARRLRINDLKNENDDLKNALEGMKLETRTMKTTYKKQERALHKYESKEGDFSSIITRHNQEVRSLREQVRNYRSKMEQSRKQYHDVSSELHKMRSDNKKLKDLVENKQLQERGDLDRKLTNAEVELIEKDKRIRELEKHIDNLNKNHRHEFAIEMHRHKDTRSQLDTLLEQNKELERELSVKNKAMETANIYYNRVGKHPSLPSGTSRKVMYSDLESLQATPRDKVERTKLYEQRRREKAKKRWEAKQRLEGKRRAENGENAKAMSDSFQTKDDSSEEEAKWEYDKADKLKFSFQRSEDRKSQEKSGDDFFVTTKRVSSPAVIPEKYEPTFETKTSSKQIKKQPTPPRERSPVRKVPTPSPPRSPTPPPRESTPPPFRPPREASPPPPKQPEKDDPALDEQRRKKDLLLARLKALDAQSEQEEEVEDIANKSRYSFSKPVDNLHHGLPAYDGVKVPYLERQKRRQSLQSDGSSNNNENRKKEDLMNVLFTSERNEDVHRGDGNERKQSYDTSLGGYKPSSGERRPTRHQVINKPVVNAVSSSNHVHDDEIEELIL